MTNRGSLSELLTSICHCSFVISHFDGKSLAFCKGFLCVLLGAHASCVPGVRNSEHAGSVRSQGRPPRSPRLRGEAFGVVFGCGSAASWNSWSLWSVVGCHLGEVVGKYTASWDRDSR